MLCRPPPSEDRRRDLIGAWHQPRVRRVRRSPLRRSIEGTVDMIVIGTDTHKKTHTCGAVDAFTARARGELTAPARKGSFSKLLVWARKLDPERVWAIEDCRHVSGAFERFLIARGERIV